MGSKLDFGCKSVEGGNIDLTNNHREVQNAGGREKMQVEGRKCRWKGENAVNPR